MKSLTSLKMEDPQRKTNLYVQPDVMARADHMLVKLALENMLRNAWKFTSKKDVACIEFGASHLNGKNIYFISDNGAGFDAKSAGDIFQTIQEIA